MGVSAGRCFFGFEFMRMKFFTAALVLALLGGYRPAARAQASFGLNAAGPAWPTDPASTRLRAALDAFLPLCQDSAARAAYLWLPTALETMALLDELADLKLNAGPPAATRLYLTNLVRLDSANYRLQLAALGTQGPVPQLQASFGLDAKLAGGKFLFYSPLARQTAAWHTRRLGAVRFHYPTVLPRKAAAAYAAQAAAFDRKLGNAGQQTDFYCCDDLPTALQALGLTHQADYQGQAHGSLSARQPGRLLVVSGDDGPDQFDPHDLWHQRLRNVVAPAGINKAADEGCAFLYGGSWGIGWPLILKQFRAYAQARPAEDWFGTYASGASVSTGAQPPLLVRYVINALIVRELERTKSFGAVRALVCCGKYEKTNTRYFQTLERVAGITPANFNATVRTLLQARDR